MKNKSLILSMVAVAILCLLIYSFFIANRENINITCHGILVTQNDQTSSRARISVFLHGKNGRVNFDGIAKNKDNEATIIRRASSFNFSHYGDTYIIYKSIVSELPGNTTPADLLIGMYPSFMLFDGMDYRFNMYPTGGNGYLFMSDKFVTLSCVR
ncbi:MULTISPECIES: hypothetical protein [unclassified Serratia (in: enterobacteria)]|uniref:hypothetical protein n=1 Tax=unclassified Serratia (in: enterobacteria) TaxID=2647522 RepID=UPI00046854B4|nr:MULTISPECIES: hypothetical protein [unclassified Serratia (in: enterobacteria)]